MKKKFRLPVFVFIGVVASLAAGFSLHYLGGDQIELTSIPSGTDSSSLETTKLTSSSNPSGGIGIYGNWTIDVYNPDGTLATSRDFKNGLTSTAPRYIGQLFGHGVTPGIWRITLGTENLIGTGPCGSRLGLPTSCVIAEATDANAESATVFNNLEVTVPDDDTVPILPLKLTGHATVTSDSRIEEVNTFIRMCNSSVSTDECVSEGNGDVKPFASTSIDRIEVTAGQIVQVKVEYSFATGQ